MGDQTQAYDIFQTPLSSGYPLPLRLIIDNKTQAVPYLSENGETFFGRILFEIIMFLGDNWKSVQHLIGARKNMRAKGSQQRTNVPTITTIIRVILINNNSISVTQNNNYHHKGYPKQELPSLGLS